MTSLDGWPTTPIARRYRVVEELGRGGQGRVYAAVDELTGRRVAIKLVLRAAQDHAAQREVSVLRALRLPGVARLLDQGVEGEHRYLVTELVEGRPFPGSPRPVPWETLAPTARHLLQALLQVHRSGVVHGDIKPGNVLVEPSGRVKLLDFGMAHAAAAVLRSASGGPVGGTLHYVAPEVSIGRRADARADLYAVGVLLVLALSDRLPWQADDLPSLLRARQTLPPALPGDMGLPLPEPVEAALRALLALDPDARPADAHQAMIALGLEQEELGWHPHWAPEGPALAARDLAMIFSGPERILHLPSDAAALLQASTGGKRAAVVHEIQAWLVEGLARVQAGQVEIERGAVELLRTRNPALEQAQAQALARALATDPPIEVAVVAATATVRAHLEDGRLRRAQAAAELGFALIRQARFPPPECVLLLQLYVRVVVALAVPGAAERGAWELRRLPRWPFRDTLAATLDAMHLALAGRASEALEISVNLPAEADEDVDALVPTVQMQAARALPTAAEAFVLDRVQRWVDRRGTPTAQARSAAWWGHLRLRQGRLEQAAELFARASSSHPEAHARLQALLDEARCLAALGRPEQAVRRARRAREQAAQTRDALREAQAWTLLRTVTCHGDTDARPDVELVDTVHLLGQPLLSGRSADAEAVLAWRQGYADTAASLASRARAAYFAAGRLPEALRSAALAALAGDAAALWWAREHFPPFEDPEQIGILIEAAALLHQATALPAWRDQGLGLGRLGCPPSPTAKGLLLSPVEALVQLGGDPATLWGLG